MRFLTPYISYPRSPSGITCIMHDPKTRSAKTDRLASHLVLLTADSRGYPMHARCARCSVRSLLRESFPTEKAFWYPSSISDYRAFWRHRWKTPSCFTRHDCGCRQGKEAKVAQDWSDVAIDESTPRDDFTVVANGGTNWVLYLHQYMQQQFICSIEKYGLRVSSL